MFPLSSHPAVFCHPLSETVYPHDSEAYKQHCYACLTDQTLRCQTEQGPIWLSPVWCGGGALTLLLVMEPRAGEIQAQPAEQDFSWERGSVRGGGSSPLPPAGPHSPCPCSPPPPPHRTCARRSWDAANAGAHLASNSFLSSQFKNNPGKYFSAGARCHSHGHRPPSRSCENRRCIRVSQLPLETSARDQSPLLAPEQNKDQEPEGSPATTVRRWPLGDREQAL